MNLTAATKHANIPPSPTYCESSFTCEDSGESSSESQGNTSRECSSGSPHRQNSESTTSVTVTSRRWLSKYVLSSSSELLPYKAIKSLGNRPRIRNQRKQSNSLLARSATKRLLPIVSVERYLIRLRVPQKESHLCGMLTMAL